MRPLFCLLALAATLPAAAQQVAPATKAPAPQPVLVFQRWGCEGTCPDYCFAVYLDGRVAYDGRFYVPVPGQRTLHLPAAEVAALLAEARRVHFEQLMGNYGHGETDRPGVSVTVQQPGQAATTIAAEVGAGPAALQAFFTYLGQRLNPRAGLK